MSGNKILQDIITWLLKFFNSFTKKCLLCVIVAQIIPILLVQKHFTLQFRKGFFYFQLFNSIQLIFIIELFFFLPCVRWHFIRACSGKFMCVPFRMYLHFQLILENPYTSLHSKKKVSWASIQTCFHGRRQHRAGPQVRSLE